MFRKSETPDILADALTQWRVGLAASGPESLSATTRARIRRETRDGGMRPARIAPLFPALRPMFAAMVPVLALALGIGLWLSGNRVERAFPGASFTVTAQKVDGLAVFLIANGTRAHRVYKSHQPVPLASSTLLTTTETHFRDDLRSDTGVVFYRID